MTNNSYHNINERSQLGGYIVAAQQPHRQHLTLTGQQPGLKDQITVYFGLVEKKKQTSTIAKVKAISKQYQLSLKLVFCFVKIK